MGSQWLKPTGHTFVPRTWARKMTEGVMWYKLSWVSTQSLQPQ